jgi:hypothetical protein
MLSQAKLIRGLTQWSKLHHGSQFELQPVPDEGVHEQGAANLSAPGVVAVELRALD